MHLCIFILMLKMPSDCLPLLHSSLLAGFEKCEKQRWLPTFKNLIRKQQQQLLLLERPSRLYRLYQKELRFWIHWGLGNYLYHQAFDQYMHYLPFKEHFVKKIHSLSSYRALFSPVGPSFSISCIFSFHFISSPFPSMGDPSLLKFFSIMLYIGLASLSHCLLFLWLWLCIHVWQWSSFSAFGFCFSLGGRC